MLHSTLSALLESVASRYAELSPSDVGIGIGGGRLVIENVKLRAETFNSHALPFYVHQGRAGRLRVNVPWSALSSSPVEVYLENVHLIAAPKLATQQPPPPPSTSPYYPSSSPHVKQNSGEGKIAKGDWHQTMVGRLLFNVSVEMYGIKLEYRDDQCVSILSIASLRAFSAGPDWNMRFVSLVEDSDPHLPHSTTTAVAMRKLVKLSGVHCVMIPRLNPNVPQNDHPTPELDRHSFESKAPILDGIAVTVRVLLCTGAAYTHATPDQLSTGLHAEVDVDLEDPKLSLTARQMEWIDHILKQGFGLGGNTANASPPVVVPYANSPAVQTKRRPRPIPPELARPTANVESEEVDGRRQALSTVSKGDKRDRSASYPPPPPSDSDSVYSSQNAKSANHDIYRDEDIDAEIEEISDFDEEGEDDYNPTDKITKPSGGGLRSLWQAIVSENGDETIDDAAIALGLAVSNLQNDAHIEDDIDRGEDQADYLFARNAVEAAANAGGVTFQLRLRTPDMAAWDEVDKLREYLRKERDMRGRLENVEAILEEAEERVKSSEEETRQLRERNAALVRELEDLERMTSQAGKNKDAMIRQMEAALGNAERRLQAMFQAEFERGQEGLGMSRNVGVSISNDLTNGLGAEHHPDPVNEEDHKDGAEGVEGPVREDQDKVGEESVGTDDNDAERVDRNNGYLEASDDDVGHDEEGRMDSSVDRATVESGREGNNVSPRILTEVAQRGHVEETYFSKVNPQRLEEAISLEGLTLI